MQANYYKKVISKSCNIHKQRLEIFLITGETLGFNSSINICLGFVDYFGQFIAAHLAGP